MKASSEISQMPPTDAEKMERLPWLLTGDLLNAGFFSLTFAGSVFLLFLNELNLAANQIGFLLSLIPFCGIVAPFIASTVSRIGYKRIFMIFWSLRTIIISLMLLTPFIISQYGPEAAFGWVSGVIGVFALCRAIGETGSYPWRKEAVPDAIRGKFSALSNIMMTLGSILVTAGASYVIGAGAGLGRFMILMMVGIGFGLISLLAYSRVPGGAPPPPDPTESGHWQGVRQALRNRDFLFFLASLGLVTIGSAAVLAFIPLFMKEKVGLDDSQVVLLSIGTYTGALLSSYLWGWAADRYGSKPVMQFSLNVMLLLPIAWFLMPRHSLVSAPLAITIAFVAGVSTLAWEISRTRYLYVRAIPADDKIAYSSTYYAWFGLVSGIAPLLAGQIIHQSQGLTGQFLIFQIDPYTPLFALSFILLFTGIIAVSKLRGQEDTSLRRFAGMFVRGNPIKALESVIQYNFAWDEITRMATTARMGEAKNPLSVRELIETLQDPSFNVRYEAALAIGRMPPEPELIGALIDTLADGPSELSFVVTRSLGRLGDPQAIPPLRQLLFSGYHLLEASSARALAMMGDTESIPTLLEKFRAEPNPVLRLAYASALGRLGAAETAPELFDLLNQIESETLRGEVGLALARLAGDERYYMQQWRSLHADPGTAAARALLALQKTARQNHHADLVSLTGNCAEQFARHHLPEGADSLGEIMAGLIEAIPDPTLTSLLRGCAAGLAQYKATRLEYILLALHLLNIGLPQLTPAKVNRDSHA